MTAGPPDLAHAIQIVREVPEGRGLLPVEVDALYATATAAEQLQATRDRLAGLEGTNATIGNDLDQANAKLADYRARIESLCDQLADLHDLLHWAYPLLDDNHTDDETWRLLNEQRVLLQTKIRAALQTDPPARGRAILEEVERLRTFEGDIRAALRPGRWRGFDGPDGVSKEEVIDDVAATLAALDLAAAREEDSGG